MKAGILYVRSKNVITSEYDQLNRNIINKLVKQFEGLIVQVDMNQALACDVLFVFVGGGGTENVFKQYLDSYRRPFYLIATNSNNSLAASMEILSYIKSTHRFGQIIHDINNEIENKVLDVLAINHCYSYLCRAKFARIGKPSDWLIASTVDAKELKNKTGITLVDVPIEELIDEIRKESFTEDEYTKQFLDLEFDSGEKKKALYVYGALMRIVSRYKINGITVRCFDLLRAVKTTSCAALALMNAQGIHSSCEGDVPSLISMAVISELTKYPAFQANPSAIDYKTNSMVFAHCTLPLTMSTQLKLNTHFESGIGVALQGKIKEGVATVFKTSGLLDKYFVSPAAVVRNLNRPDLCRTQIEVKLDKSVNYFFNQSIGNHHIVVNDDCADMISSFFATFFPEAKSLGEAK